jgi:hypothetical protein
LSEVQRYVLLYMPGAATLLGLLLVYRRRSVERKSRSEKPAKPPRAKAETAKRAAKKPAEEPVADEADESAKKDG